MDKQKKSSTWAWVIVPTAALIAGVLVSLVLGMSNKLGPEYSYDIEQYTKIDPSLILYRQVGTPIETGLEESRAVCVDSAGIVYAVGDKKLVSWNSNNRNEMQLPSEPTCIGVDKDATVIVGLTDHLAFLNPDGTIKQQWQPPAKNALLTSIAVDEENVYAADAINKFVWRFNRQGVVVNRIGAKETKRDIPGFVVPSPYFDIAMYPDGLLRAVNPGRHLIEAYTPQGDREWTWGKTAIKIDGFSGCCNPVSFAVLPDGGFVTCEKGLVRVKIYDAEGNFVGVVAGPDELDRTEIMRVCDSPKQCSQQSFDCAVDNAARIYVLDMQHNTIRIFEKK